MSNVNVFYDELLAAFGATPDADNVNDFRDKFVAAVTAMVADKVSGTTIVALGGSIAGTANDTMTVSTDIALSTSNTYTDAAVNTAVNAVVLQMRNNMADLQAKVNELITAIA